MAPKDVARLWEELRHRDPEEKLDWIRQLAKDPTPDAVGVLLDALEQESWFLRDQAATALASMGSSCSSRCSPASTRASVHARGGRRGAGPDGPRRRGRPAHAGAARPEPHRARCGVGRARRAGARRGLGPAVAEAFAALPERALRFALDGLYSRDADSGDRIAALINDPALRAAGERADSSALRATRPVCPGATWWARTWSPAGRAESGHCARSIPAIGSIPPGSAISRVRPRPFSSGVPGTTPARSSPSSARATRAVRGSSSRSGSPGLSPAKGSPS